MKTIITIFLVFIVCNTYSQGNIKYVSSSQPVKLWEATAKDNAGFYHIYYGFNFDGDSTSNFTSNDNLIIDRLYVKGNNSTSPLTPYQATGNSESYDFKVPYSDIRTFEKVTFWCEYRINNVVYKSTITQLRVQFPGIATLKVDVSLDGVYLESNDSTAIVHIKSNQDGTKITNLSIKQVDNAAGADIATLQNPSSYTLNANVDVRIELKKNDGQSLNPGQTYYLFGDFQKPALGTSYSIPNNNREYALKVKQQYYVTDPGDMSVIGKYDHVLNNVQTSAKCKSLTLEILDKTIPEGLRVINGIPNGPSGTSWSFTINSANDAFSYQDYSVKFSGRSQENTPIIENRFVFRKLINDWKNMKVDFNQGTYTVTVDLLKPSSDVQLNLDNSMTLNMTPAGSNKYNAFFNFSDPDMKTLTTIIARETDNKKDIEIGVNIDGQKIRKFVISSVTVLDKNDLKGKSKKEIKQILEDSGIEEDINKITKSIADELEKDDKSQEWDQVWSTVVSVAPKVFTIVLALI
ncbi:hypothetical protein [Fulvivirga sediminis]|uniref:Uncharacterized protein n=1 Tax=Fulvivirga sediminis TaxID=2803949 RepID=A0A937F7R6_9BACT|nr:hypothetical protein [Fulvivirga sediminis]MBL3657290.1 hypothetical protein [Fulvivirga sediminis]